MQETLFVELSAALAATTGVALIFRWLRQPLIIAYIVTGFLIGPAVFNVITNQEAFASFSQIGIALLLFIIGLTLNSTVIRATGKPVALTFMAIVLVVGGAGWALTLLMGFDPTAALVATIGLMFSSTIIVIKALSDKNEQTRLYGQIAIGITLVEDIAATTALLVVAALGSAATGGFNIGYIWKGLALGLFLVFCGAKVMPRLGRVLAKNQELLTLFSLAWGLSVASIFHLAGFSIEVGALFAGVALAHIPYAQEMSARLKPIRDFFVVLFFLNLGSRLGISNLSSAILPALALAGVVLLVKPIAIMTSLGLLGYTKQAGFKVAVHLSQISEFSIVLVILAATLGIADSHLVAVMTLTAIITIVVSTYLIRYDTALFKRLRQPLSIFERASTRTEVSHVRDYPIVLLGYRKGGHDFVNAFREMKKRYVVIDYDPDVVEVMKHHRINHIYGDAMDLELLEEIGIHRSELIVSTIGDIDVNKLMIGHIARHRQEAVFICHARNFDDAKLLYEMGASYVLLPHYIGNEHLAGFIRKHGSDRAAFEKFREKHIEKISKSLIGD